MKGRVAAAIAAFLVVLAMSAAPAVLGAAGLGAADGIASAAIKADRDGDKVFDDLENRLALAEANEPVSVIVALTEPASPSRLRALRESVGPFSVTHRFSLIDGFAATVTKGQARALARIREVRHVEENSSVHAYNNTAQDSFGVTKARADAPSIQGDGDGDVDTYSSSDLVAAVIDTGIDAGHRDLDEGKVIAFKDLVNGKDSPYDDEGHGTHVAATIAGDGDGRSDFLYKGVAPGAALVGVKVLNASGSGTMADVTAGIDWVVAHKAVYGIEAINLSLGTNGCSDGKDATSLAVNAAHAAGIVVAVAAGNAGPGTCTIGAPGAAAGALTVGAMADMGEGGFKQAYFSSRGRTADGRIKPDISAPGVRITSAAAGTVNGYVVSSGTSMAAPFAAGVSLLVRDAASALSSQQVKDKIMQTAVDWGRGGDNRNAGSSGIDIDYGAGRLDAYAAISSATFEPDSTVPPISSPPPTPSHELREGTLTATGAQVDYELNVTDTRFPIAATLIMPTVSGSTASSPDFDLYLFDPSGNQVASALTTRRQEDLGYKPAVTGAYKLRVRSYQGNGAYFVDVSAGGSVSRTDVIAFPTKATILAGTLRSGSASRLSADDSSYYEVNSTTSGTRTTSWYGSFPGIPNGFTSLNITYSGKNSRTCSQKIAVRRWSDGTWVQLDSRSVSTTEVAVANLTPPGSLADYISGDSGDGELQVRVLCTKSSSSFYAKGDLMKIAYSS